MSLESVTKTEALQAAKTIQKLFIAVRKYNVTTLECNEEIRYELNIYLKFTNDYKFIFT